MGSGRGRPLIYRCRLGWWGSPGPGYQKYLLTGVLPGAHPDLTTSALNPFFGSFRAPKNVQKTALHRKLLFLTISGFSDLYDVNSGAFWVPKRVPGHNFLVIFRGKTWSRFWSTFLDIFLEKMQKRKKRKSSFRIIKYTVSRGLQC